MKCESANWTEMAHDRVQWQVFNNNDSLAIWININCCGKKKRVSKTVIAAVCPTSANQWDGVHDADTLTAVAVHVLLPGNTDWSCSSFLFLCAAAWWSGAGWGLLHVSHNTCCSPLPQLSQHALAPYGPLAILLSSPVVDLCHVAKCSFIWTEEIHHQQTYDWWSVSLSILQVKSLLIYVTGTEFNSAPL